jgi:hypothetical protein
MQEYFDEIVDFCYTFVVLENGDARHTIMEGYQDTQIYKPFNFCEE